jgi:hypothetical protein
METELILSLGIEIANALDATHAVGTADRFRRYCDFGSSRMYPSSKKLPSGTSEEYKIDVQ